MPNAQKFLVLNKLLKLVNNNHILVTTYMQTVKQTTC